VPKNHHDPFKHEIERLVKLGVLKRSSDSEWADLTLIIPKKNGTVRFISDFRKLIEMLKRKPYPNQKLDKCCRNYRSLLMQLLWI
jgi:hypothetical protein